MTFQLAACAEMLWRDRPIEWRASRLKEMGFGVGLWNWPAHDLAKLEATGATFTIMNGYLEGRVTSRKVIWLFPEQFRLQFVPVLHRLQGCLAAQG